MRRKMGVKPTFSSIIGGGQSGVGALGTEGGTNPVWPFLIGMGAYALFGDVVKGILGVGRAGATAALGRAQKKLESRKA